MKVTPRGGVPMAAAETRVGVYRCLEVEGTVLSVPGEARVLPLSASCGGG